MKSIMHDTRTPLDLCLSFCTAQIIFVIVNESVIKSLLVRFLRIQGPRIWIQGPRDAKRGVSCSWRYDARLCYLGIILWSLVILILVMIVCYHECWCMIQHSDHVSCSVKSTVTSRHYLPSPFLRLWHVTKPLSRDPPYTSTSASALSEWFYNGSLRESGSTWSFLVKLLRDESLMGNYGAGFWGVADLQRILTLSILIDLCDNQRLI